MQEEFTETFDKYINDKFEKFYKYNFENSNNLDKSVNFWKKHYMQKFIFDYLRLHFIYQSFAKINSTKNLFNKLRPKTKNKFKNDIEILGNICNGLNYIIEKTLLELAENK